ncbi:MULTISPECIES: acylneuraminate cytidylyltransferase family protein [Salinibaculum]|uniref:acylneuraminate cytidylyltransferase family protein n=1 Tax=Salinibaculum TaxID=2732368 RepID=UPI0030D1B98D
MSNAERVVAAIPARGGSKSVRRKNVREVGGKPLLAWSIEVAIETDAIGRTIVSTDSDEIAAVAKEYGAEVSERPARLAADDALVIDTLRDLIKKLRRDGEQAKYMAMLEPTCPFRAPKDVQSALDLLMKENFDSVASFTDAKLNPHRAWTIEDNQPRTVTDAASPWQPRQALPEAYELNGGVYAFVMDALPDSGPALLFGHSGAITMPPERSVDIDQPLDLEFARLIADRRH